MAGLQDPLNFVAAEQFFHHGKAWGGPSNIASINTTAPDTVQSVKHWRGVNVTFDDHTIAVIQFIRPSLFRVRYDPSVRDINDYEDFSSRTVIGSTTSGLIADLDEWTGLSWETILDEFDDHYAFRSAVVSVSKESKKHYKPGDGLKVNLFKNPFRIQATRLLTPHPDRYPIPGATAAADRTAERVIWQSSPNTFRHFCHSEHKMLKNVILEVIKPGHGEYMGFGEQGGMAFLKKPTFMNYFNFDNMQYQQVYNRGPMDPREPLYHNDPFFMDVNSNPEHANITATFIDNYSQIAIDLGKTNSGFIKLGTRFGGIDIYAICADDMPEIVRLYTGITGRPKLKPRFVLGNHQACYGYVEASDCFAVVEQYRQAGIPLDGLHIDVDLQDNFRTFTTNDASFPNFKQMMTDLRNRGIKCSTNITPVISINTRPQGYRALDEGKEKKYFVFDKRYLGGTTGRPEDVRYVCYGGGSYYEIDPNSVPCRPDFGDNYDFRAVFNSQNQFYHGGVSYGYRNGTAGFYPDLNRKEVRDWWGTQYSYLMDSGLEFVWQDMTTPAIHTSYGDMKGFPTRLYISSDVEKSSVTGPKEVLAIEAWALYSYNLHKATFHGLEKLQSRKGKRNFILGRGSFAGAFRFAGLWSGDNASTWDFWRITVSQVLSVGLNGVSISGSDLGGFEPAKGPDGSEERYCSPELMIRWSSGSFLLPWFRNHYVGAKKDRKWFQEPYAYRIHWDSHQEELKGLKWLYYGVERIYKYYVELRYTLMQVLYDAMFENQISGLPIARSMLFTDTQDSSFFNESQEFLDTQYVTGRDILVAPIFEPKSDVPDESRDVYLPVGYHWYPSNLRPWDSDALKTPLLPAVDGGSVINYVAKIPEDENAYEQYAYVLPVYIREGAIIPQLPVQQWVHDFTTGPSHVKWNIYPGRDNEYVSYFDDGVSRNSAPTNIIRYKMKSKKAEKLKKKTARSQLSPADVDPESKGFYREVSVKQRTGNGTRTVSIEPKHNHYDPSPQFGTSYTIMLWYSPDVENIDKCTVSVTTENASTTYEVQKNGSAKWVKVVINETPGASAMVKISVAVS